MALDKSKTYHLMEVCGTHTMAIAKSGIRNVLPQYIRLVSGPGCPVCVTPPEVIDEALRLTERPNVIIATYGDMIRVPGSVKGDNLAKRSAMGAKVRIVYSAMDALEIAKAEPESEVVFLGVGFETSAPGTATSVEEAKRQGIGNYSVFSMLKMLEPSIRALAADPEFNVQGFICPGHVAVILGEQGLKFFEELGLPAVIAGFDTDDIVNAVRMLMVQIAKGEARLENQYTDVVRPEGNPMARELMDKFLVPRKDIWRGLGEIEQSGYGLRPEYAAWDAEQKFDIHFGKPVIKTACRCGDVVKGKLDPMQCPLFGTVCVPEDPEGPCMVSAEGACAAAYKYRAF
ncbi:MAG: hydrogenase formation protein HypD [Lachnospiraceae bacterium]|nr:hydrogenase formation protein HypD [Lachnospiraceae bacterium]